MENMTHEDDIQKIRQRLHNISDTVHAHGMRLELQGLEITNVKKQVEGLQQSMATSQQLESASELVQLKLDHVAGEINQIKRFILGGIGITLTAVLVAVLSLVVR